MTRSEMRRSLKRGTARLVVETRPSLLEPGEHYLLATLTLTHSSWSESYTYHGVASRGDGPHEVWRRFPGYGGFRSFTCIALVNLLGENERIKNALLLSEVLAHEIERLNLLYRYPDCELSRIVAAFESLTGTPVTLESVDGISHGKTA